MLTQNLPDFWDNLYAEGKDYWNLKKVTPALTEFFKHPSCPATGSVLVPGAGFGYDAEAWALRGHDVLAVDFAPSAVDELDHLSRKHKNLRSLDLDLFSLSPKDDKRGGQLFDIVYDYCCFTAIHPGRRDEFFEVCYKMMKDDGLLILFLYPLMNGKTLQGPPPAKANSWRASAAYSTLSHASSLQAASPAARARKKFGFSRSACNLDGKCVNRVKRNLLRVHFRGKHLGLELYKTRQFIA